MKKNKKKSNIHSRRFNWQEPNKKKKVKPAATAACHDLTCVREGAHSRRFK